MKHFTLFWITAALTLGQPSTATVEGMVLDAGNGNPIPTAVVSAIRTGTPPFAANTRSGADGSFRIQGLVAGDYDLCTQVTGERYFDPCVWGQSQTKVTLSPGQDVTGVVVKLETATPLTIDIQDGYNVLQQLTKDGRRPDLSVGVWGPKGLYYPAHCSKGPGVTGILLAAKTTYSCRIAIPRNMGLTLYVASHDIKLGDETGVMLFDNTSRQALQPTAGDPSPKRFTFSVLGFLP